MKITLIRHTTPLVPKGLCYGQTDVDVADSFSQEVAFIKAKLKLLDFSKTTVFSSPLQRCHQLAEELFSDNFTIDNKLLELNFGDWEMKSWDEIHEADSQYWFDDWVNQKTPNGESYQDLFSRCVEFWEEVKSKEIESVCVISHAGFIKASNAYFKGLALEDSFDLKVGFGEVIELHI